MDSLAGGKIDIINPYTGQKLTNVAEVRAEDVDRAVKAAQKAAPGWARLAAHERGRLLLKLADAIEAETEYLARLEATNTGHPVRDCLNLDVPRTVSLFSLFRRHGRQNRGLCYTR